MRSIVTLSMGLLLIAACAPAVTPTPLPAPMTTVALASLPSVTMTSTPVPTWTATPLSTRTSAPTSTPIPSSTPIPTPSATPVCAGFMPARSTAALELYGTINAMGVAVSIDPNDDPDQNAIASIEYRSGSRPFRTGFPLSRVGNNRFVGSLFGLDPATPYDVRVTFIDKGGVLNCTSLAGSSLTRAEPDVPKANQSYVVSPTGKGTMCSLEVPCSLVDGLDRAGPGDAVLLRGGTYFQGEINLPRSGRADAPIVIRSSPGEKAILDGSDPTVFKWTSVEKGIYQTAVQVAGFDMVAANDQRLYPYKSLADLESLRWDLPGFFSDGGTLYVHLVGNADPNATRMAISRQKYAFWIGQSNIYVLDLTFRYYSEARWNQAAVQIRKGTDNVLQGNTFILNNIGIGFHPTAHRNLIQNNEFIDTVRDWPWDAVYDGTRLTGAGGIRFLNPDGNNAIARGNVIRRNTFHNLFDGFGACPFQKEGDTTNETDVYENLVYQVTDDGMEADGWCSNVRIWNNTVRDSITGISLAPARGGPVYAIRNLIYNTSAAVRAPLGQVGPCCGTAFKFQYSEPGSGSGPIYLFHNTAVAGPNSRGMYLVDPVILSKLVLRNNIWVGNRRVALANSVDDPVDFDYDDLWATGINTIAEWGDRSFANLSAFTGSTAQESRGMNVNPEFVDRDKADYRLSPKSPLIDAGVLVPSINDDFQGRAPDIGAFENTSR